MVILMCKVIIAIRTNDRVVTEIYTFNL